MEIIIKPKPLLIAVCGKGGVGKTSISALVVRTLAEENNCRILAIDADPAVGLAIALGFRGNRTVNDIRNDLIGRIEEGEGENRQALLASLDYEVFAALEERGNVAFLAIGRPEKEGCYCRVNTMLRDIIESVAQNFDFVVIDGEAGIEQVNRRVLSTVTHLLLVSDASAKGLKVTETIRSVAGKAVSYEKAGLLLNRIRGEEEKGRLSLPRDIELIGWIPEDDGIREADITGRNLMEIPSCPAVNAVHDLLDSFLRGKD
jgi:CO dehydrogenase maturation factor